MQNPSVIQSPKILIQHTYGSDGRLNKTSPSTLEGHQPKPYILETSDVAHLVISNDLHQQTLGVLLLHAYFNKRADLKYENCYKEFLLEKIIGNEDDKKMGHSTSHTKSSNHSKKNHVIVPTDKITQPLLVNAPCSLGSIYWSLDSLPMNVPIYMNLDISTLSGEKVFSTLVMNLKHKNENIRIMSAKVFLVFNLHSYFFKLYL
jgi:hypothetical protein